MKLRPVRHGIKIPLPSRPSLSNTAEQEQLIGEVEGMKASAPEERMARALSKANIAFRFRYVVGAPKGLPGWKELDFVVMSKGLIYAVEVDTAFTHREKAFADVLHDAIVLNDSELNTLGQLYPQVLHVDGESDLASNDNAEKFVKRSFGSGIGSSSYVPEGFVGFGQTPTTVPQTVSSPPAITWAEDSKKKTVKKKITIPPTVKSRPIKKGR